MAHDHHETVVTDSGGGLGTGMIIGIILAILLVALAVWYFGFGGFTANNSGTDINVDVNAPSLEVPEASG